jgi:hypothetical protein
MFQNILSEHHSGAKPVTNVNSGLMLWHRERLLECDLLGYARFVGNGVGRCAILLNRIHSTSLSQRKHQPHYRYSTRCCATGTRARRKAAAPQQRSTYGGSLRYASLAYRDDGVSVLKKL